MSKLLGGKTMKNNIKRIGIGLGAIIILGGSVVFSEVGTDRDPLVTKTYVDSYVNKKIDEIRSYIDKKLVNTEANEFVVVEVSKGKSIILGGGSEVILRAGQARSISKIRDGIDNGLANVTAGKDLKMDELLTLNHLLLTPRDDGRGARAFTNSTFLVRGKYEIK